VLEDARDRARRVGHPREECRTLLLLSLAMGLLDDRRDRELSLAALELAEQHGAESSKAWALWGLGLAQWRAGDYAAAGQSLREGVRLFQGMRNFNGVSFCVQGLSWCAAFSSPDEHAARLMGAVQAVWRSTGGNVAQATYLQSDHLCEERLREALGSDRFDAAYAEGASYPLDLALETALGVPAEASHESDAVTGATTALAAGLTAREWQVAELLAGGLSNKEIADRLVISQRTVETHVEHILTKLGFRSRVQVSAWVAEEHGHPTGG
jgi:DNA-binding CsgD family transcriptional regulator